MFIHEGNVIIGAIIQNPVVLCVECTGAVPTNQCPSLFTQHVCVPGSPPCSSRLTSPGPSQLRRLPSHRAWFCWAFRRGPADRRPLGGLRCAFWQVASPVGPRAGLAYWECPIRCHPAALLIITDGLALSLGAVSLDYALVSRVDLTQKFLIWRFCYFIWRCCCSLQMHQVKCLFLVWIY